MSRGEMRGSSIRLQTTDADLRALELAASAKRRKGSTTIAVDAEALRHIVADHGELFAALQSRRLLNIAVGQDQESLT